MTSSVIDVRTGSVIEVEAAVEDPGNPGPPMPEPVPDVVSPFQARVALLSAGILDAVENAVNSSSAEVRIAWEYATEWRRDSPVLADLAGQIGLTEAQVDALFIAAAEVRA